MSIESTFLNLNRGNRLTAMMGLELGPEAGKPVFGAGYSYVEIPLAPEGFELLSDNSRTSKALRNQVVTLIPNCKLNVRGGLKVLAVVNPAIHNVANCPTMLLLESDQGMQPHFVAQFRKDFQAEELTWACRLYLLS